MKKILYIVLVMIFVLNSPMPPAHAERSQTLDIETFPKDKFLEIDRLKPGDTVSSSLDVINNGSLVFTYKTTAQFTGGSKKYYDSLHLNIKDNTGMVLFDGSLKDFNGIKPRQLSILKQDRLKIAIGVPPELGNDYQGLSANLKLTFMAYSDDYTIASANGEQLPDTATNSYNFITIGLLLLCCGIGTYFYLKKSFL
jgi:hypothetical protein